MRYINRIKRKTYTVTPTDTGKPLNATQHYFIMIINTQTMNKKKFSIIKTIYKNPTAKIIFWVFLRSEAKQGCLLSSLLFNMTTES